MNLSALCAIPFLVAMGWIAFLLWLAFLAPRNRLQYVTLFYQDGHKESQDGVLRVEKRGVIVHLWLSNGVEKEFSPVAGMRVVESRNQPQEKGNAVGSEWSKLPVAQQKPIYCGHCNGLYEHEVRYHYDEPDVPQGYIEYRRCTHCNFESEWVFSGRDLVMRAGRRKDTSVDEYDWKRRADRRYHDRAKRGGKFVPPKEDKE